jgi:transcriptional regulator with XRE-family HTH domain
MWSDKGRRQRGKPRITGKSVPRRRHTGDEGNHLELDPPVGGGVLSQLRLEAGVSIGGALAEAREQAGLSVFDVSQRTRIRETIIRGIEQDDYSACGGDFYARGHIRAIARTVGTDPAPLINEYDATQATPEELPTEDDFEPARPIRDPIRFRAPPWKAVAALAALILLVVILHYALDSAAKPTKSAASAAVSATRHHGKHGRSGHPSSSHSPSPRPSASPSGVVQDQLLAPVSASAFGPGGAGHGDNPQLARLAIDHSMRTAWQTDWYATPTFGGLQAGTGLLIDLGKQVTIASAKLTLGTVHGASIQLRTGNTATLAGLQPQATVTGAAGLTQISLPAPVQARYLLIWFTRLPADSAGTFQALLYNVAVYGSP